MCLNANRMYFEIQNITASKALNFQHIKQTKVVATEFKCKPLAGRRLWKGGVHAQIRLFFMKAYFNPKFLSQLN